jgi:hypothetical protein
MTLNRRQPMNPIARLKRLLALVLFAGAGMAAELRHPGPCPLAAVQAKRRELP